MLVFRVQESCPENLVDTLKECIDSFEGKISWKVFENPMTRKTNSDAGKTHCRDFIKNKFLLKVCNNFVTFF